MAAEPLGASAGVQTVLPAPRCSGGDRLTGLTVGLMGPWVSGFNSSGPTETSWARSDLTSLLLLRPASEARGTQPVTQLVPSG